MPPLNRLNPKDLANPRCPAGIRLRAFAFSKEQLFSHGFAIVAALFAGEHVEVDPSLYDTLWTKRR